MANIGDLYYAFRGDGARLQQDAKVEGAKAGDTLGKSITGSLTQSFSGAQIGTKLLTGLGVGMAGAFAIATKGALELENATARFRAETGATAAEADKMGKAINNIAGSERMSLQAVTDIAIKVKNDMGATGDEAVALTKKIAQFARVTGQDGAAVVTAFDNALDAWNLTAADAAGIMDKLLISQRKFGGTIPEMTSSLAALAPAMQAANMTIDDGIGLLGLFNSAGVDAATASVAFTKALGKVKSPEELQRLIDDISNTADPFLRAQKAADLFGAKAGPRLAQALAGAHIKDYTISMDEAAGATQEAADVLDSTFSGRVQKAISMATAGLREFGASFGPALTGAAALASLFAPIGAPLVKSVLGPLAKMGPRIKQAIVGSIMSAIIPAKIAGEAVGVAEAEGMAEGAASGKAAGIVGKAGQFLGTAMGKAMALGFAAVAIVELVRVFQDTQAQIKTEAESLAKQTGTYVETATLEALQHAREGVAQQLKSMGNDPIAEALGLSAKKGVQDTLATLDAAIAAKMTDATHTSRAAAEGWGAATVEGYSKGVESADVGGFEGMRGKVADALQKAVAIAGKYGGLTVQEYIKGVSEKKTALSDAFDALLTTQKTSMTRMQELAKTIGILTSKQLAQGLKDARPDVRLAAEQIQKDGLERLGQLVRGGNKIGKDGMAALATAMKSKNPEVRAAAVAIKGVIEKNLKPSPNAASAASATAGKNAANAFDKGWTTHAPTVPVTIHVNVPSGAKAAKFIEDKFAKIGLAGGGDVTGGQPYIVGEKRPELFVPNVSGHIYPTVASGMAAAGSTGGTTNVTVALPVSARPDPFEVANQLRRLADFGVLGP